MKNALFEFIKFIENMVNENLEDVGVRMQMNYNKIDLVLNKKKFVLVNREVIYLKGPFMRLMPLYLELFNVKGVVNKNAYYIQYSDTKRKSNQVNVKNMKLYHKRSVVYAKPTEKPSEKTMRVHQISQFIGWNEKRFYVKMEKVDPVIMVEYSKNYLLIHNIFMKKK